MKTIWKGNGVFENKNEIIRAEMLLPKEEKEQNAESAVLSRFVQRISKENVSSMFKEVLVFSTKELFFNNHLVSILWHKKERSCYKSVDIKITLQWCIDKECFVFHFDNLKLNLMILVEKVDNYNKLVYNVPEIFSKQHLDKNNHRS